jgi:hypothetical protein
MDTTGIDERARGAESGHEPEIAAIRQIVADAQTFRAIQAGTSRSTGPTRASSTSGDAGSRAGTPSTTP